MNYSYPFDFAIAREIDLHEKLFNVRFFLWHFKKWVGRKWERKDCTIIHKDFRPWVSVNPFIQETGYKWTHKPLSTVFLQYFYHNGCNHTYNSFQAWAVFYNRFELWIIQFIDASLCKFLLKRTELEKHILINSSFKLNFQII